MGKHKCFQQVIIFLFFCFAGNQVPLLSPVPAWHQLAISRRLTPESGHGQPVRTRGTGTRYDLGSVTIVECRSFPVKVAIGMYLQVSIDRAPSAPYRLLCNEAALLKCRDLKALIGFRSSSAFRYPKYHIPLHSSLFKEAPGLFAMLTHAAKYHVPVPCSVPALATSCPESTPLYVFCTLCRNYKN
jgi:hypothetical protein